MISVRPTVAEERDADRVFLTGGSDFLLVDVVNPSDTLCAPPLRAGEEWQIAEDDARLQHRRGSDGLENRAYLFHAACELGMIYIQQYIAVSGRVEELDMGIVDPHHTLNCSRGDGEGAMRYRRAGQRRRRCEYFREIR